MTTYYFSFNMKPNHIINTFIISKIEHFFQNEVSRGKLSPVRSHNNNS
jgi:hypothetical protein